MTRRRQLGVTVAALLATLAIAAPATGGVLPPVGLPAATTGDLVGITTTAATLTGTVSPRGLPTSYHFDYGSGLGYGQSTPAQDAGSGTADVPVSATLAGLAPGSIIHYRLVAANATGTANGLDRLLILLPLAGGGGGPLLPGKAPQILALDLPTNPVVGRPVTLTARADSPDQAVNAITVDFGENGAFFGESACRKSPPSKLFDGAGSSRFKVPYVFRNPGVHQVAITLFSGGCGRARRSVTQVLTIDALPATASRHGSFPEAVAAAACKGAGALPAANNLKLIRSATRCLLNQRRKANGLGALRPNKKLTKAAALHTNSMLRGHFFSHQGPSEPGLGDRFGSVRYSAGGGENLGVGSGLPWATPAGMVDAWMNSPTHRANILETHYRTIGITVIPRKPTPDPPTPGATYTTEFGRK